MKLSTGRWVNGDDFFDRERELRVLALQAREHNHILLTGQRRMGKTSVARELGRRLEADGWVFLFADVEGATCPEDAIAEIAKAAHPVQTLRTGLGARMRRLGERVHEVGVAEFRVQFRAGLDVGSWRHHGQQLLHDCAQNERPVLLVIDELPIFLKRMLRGDRGAERIDEFLSWLRGVLQGVGDASLTLIVSGSIGLAPLVRRLGIPDRINHLYPFRLGPWDRTTSVACFARLARAYGIRVEAGVAEAVHDQLGIGVPHHVQSFFARLRDFTLMQGRDRLTVEDVATVYRSALLGPPGQNDLVHYETRLKEGLDDHSYSIAMEVLAEASLLDGFTPAAHRHLERLYANVMDDVPARIADALEVLVHDGYLEAEPNGHVFVSHLLKDWWAARFRGSHIPLAERLPGTSQGEIHDDSA